MEAPTEVWTTRRLIKWTEQFLAKKGVDHARLSAEMLLAHVLSCGRLKLYTDADRPASDLERAAFRELVERAGRHEPVDYLIGKTPFFSLLFKVTPDVLIPRPSTETLVEHVMQHTRRTPGFAMPAIADIGTGSGIIAITLAKHLPGCRVVAVDISPKAIEVAKENAHTHGVESHIDFRLGHLLEPLAGMRFRFLCSNPPYISDAEWQQVEPNVKEYEPVTALRGGHDGLDFIRPIIQHAHRFLDTPGQLCLEFAASQKDAVLKLAQNAPGLANAHILNDHERLPRILVADHVG